MEKNAQGAIEYLLIIGAAILIVAVVIIALVSVAGTATDRTDEGEVDQATLIMQCQAECIKLGSNFNWNSGINRCMGDGFAATDFPEKCYDFNTAP
jgi:hypothetical protein